MGGVSECVSNTRRLRIHRERGTCVLGCSVVCRWQVARRLESVEAGTGYGGSAFVSRTCRYHCECTRMDLSAPIRLDSEKGLRSNKGPSRRELGTLLFCVVAGFMNSG